MAIINANDDSFTDEVLQATVPVVVEFSRPGKNAYPGPDGKDVEQDNDSLRTNGILNALADEYVDKVKIVRVDLDACPKAAKLCGVTAAPTVFYIQRVRDFRLKFWIKKRIDAMLE
jgi:thioredoxin 1